MLASQTSRKGGDGWWVLVLYQPACNYYSFLPFQSLVSSLRLPRRLFCSRVHCLLQIARVLMVRGQFGQAEAVMRKIYSHASEEQLKLKVKVLQAGVEASAEISRTTTLFQRIKSILFIGTNRRALSKLSNSLILLCTDSSGCLQSLHVVFKHFSNFVVSIP